MARTEIQSTFLQAIINSCSSVWRSAIGTVQFLRNDQISLHEFSAVIQRILTVNMYYVHYFIIFKQRTSITENGNCKLCQQTTALHLGCYKVSYCEHIKQSHQLNTRYRIACFTLLNILKTAAFTQALKHFLRGKLNRD